MDKKNIVDRYLLYILYFVNCEYIESIAKAEKTCRLFCVYGHVSEKMKDASADRMQKYIENL